MVSRRTLLTSAPLLGAGALLGTPLLTTTAFAQPAPKQITVDASSPYSNIKALQHLLTAYGIPTTADGIFGPATTTSIRTFQLQRKNDGFTGTGTAGPKTMAAMLRGSNVAVTLNWPNPDTVKAAQQLLVKTGRTVPVDGTFTTTDADKIRNFQSAYKLDTTGKLDHTTWTYLFEPADASTGTPAAFNGKISRAEVISRAKTWLDGPYGPAVVYNMGSTTSRPDGGAISWRQDCSGYASMCLKVRHPRNLAGLSTGQWHPSAGLGLLTRVQDKKQAKPGDVFLATAAELGMAYGHIMIFDKWADAAKTSAWFYEQTNAPGTFRCMHRVLTWPVSSAGVKLYRYVNIVD